MKRLHWWAIIGLMLLWLGSGLAQNNAPGGANGGNAKPKPEAAAGGPQAQNEEEDRFQIEHADILRHDAAANMWYLRGNVIFAREDMKLYCDEADYNEEADTAVARGHLRVVEPDSVTTGDLMDADFGKELAIITGNVTIVTQKHGNKAGEKPQPGLDKPKPQTGNGGDANETQPDGQTTAEKPKDGRDPEHIEDYWEEKTTITCERAEYYYADDVEKMIATPRVKAVQEERTVWADTAVYEDIPRQLTLTGNVILITKDGDEMHCAKAVVWVDHDRVEAKDINVVTLRKKKKEEPKPGPAEQPAPAPAPAPAQPEGSQ